MHNPVRSLFCSKSLTSSRGLHTRQNLKSSSWYISLLWSALHYLPSLNRSLETQSVLWLTPAGCLFTKMSQEEAFGGRTDKDLSHRNPMSKSKTNIWQQSISKTLLVLHYLRSGACVCLSHPEQQLLRQAQSRWAASYPGLSWEAGSGREWLSNFAPPLATSLGVFILVF